MKSLISSHHAVGPFYEVVIIEDLKAKDTRAILKAMQTKFIPNEVLLFRHMNFLKQKAEDIVSLTRFTQYHSSIDGKATAYAVVTTFVRFL